MPVKTSRRLSLLPSLLVALCLCGAGDSASAQSDLLNYLEANLYSKQVFDGAVAQLFAQKRFESPISRLDFAHRSGPSLFPNSKVLLEPEQGWGDHFSVIANWRPTGGERLSLSGTDAEVGDVVVLKSGGDVLPMVYVGENRFTDWSKTPDAAEHSSFFIYPFSIRAGLELNTMPPRWRVRLLVAYVDPGFSEYEETDFDEEVTRENLGMVRYSASGSYDGLSASWREHDGPKLPTHWIQSPRIRGSLYVPTRWWKAGVSYVILRATGAEEDILQEAQEIIESVVWGPGMVPYKLNDEGYADVWTDLRVERAEEQWEKFRKEADEVSNDPSSTDQEKKSAAAKAEKAEKVYRKVGQFVAAEYERAGLAGMASGRVGGDLVTDVVFDSILTLGVGAVARLGGGTIKVGSEALAAKYGDDAVVKAAVEDGSRALAAKYGDDAVIRVTSKESFEITTAAGEREVLRRGKTVWDAIEATQDVYPGSVIPRSFKLTTPDGAKVWVHGNATEHIAEFAAMKAKLHTPEAVRLASQAQLSSLQAAVNTATRNGVPFGKLIEVGGWELKFAAPRNPGDLPALIHALMK